MRIQSLRRSKGFTLTETVIAIGVVALLMAAFIAVIGPTRRSIKNSIAKEEAENLTRALETELVTLRSGTADKEFKTGFEKAFEWVINSHKREGGIFLYSYSADPTRLRRDDTMTPIVGEDREPGVTSVTIPMCRRVDDPNLEEDIPAIEGNLYFARLTQLTFNETGDPTMMVGEPGEIINPDGNKAATISDYEEAGLALKMDVFIVPSRSLNYLRKTFDPTELGKPAFSRNIAVRR